MLEKNIYSDRESLMFDFQIRVLSRRDDLFYATDNRGSLITTVGSVGSDYIYKFIEFNGLRLRLEVAFCDNCPNIEYSDKPRPILFLV